VGIALSGAVGPLMTATAYLFSTPHLVGVETNPQLSSYLVAPYSVLAGLVGSMIAVAAVTAMDNSRNRRRVAAEAPVPVTPAILPTPRSTTPSWLESLDNDALPGTSGSDPFPSSTSPSGLPTSGRSSGGSKSSSGPKLPPGGLASGATGSGVST